MKRKSDMLPVKEETACMISTAQQLVFYSSVWNNMHAIWNFCVLLDY